MGSVTTLTRKGQVTIPKAIRDTMGLKPADRIEIYREDGETKLRRAYPTLDEVAGSLPPLGMSVEEALTQAKDERAARLVEKLKQS